MAGARALVWEETTGLDWDPKVLMASQAEFEHVHQPAKDGGRTLLPGLAGRALFAGVWRVPWKTSKDHRRMLLLLVSPWPAE